MQGNTSSLTELRDRDITDVRLTMKNNLNTLIPFICVKGAYYKSNCYLVLFILCPVRVMSISDSELTANSRYPAPHLEMLPGYMPCPHHTEAVIHCNAIRKEFKY